MVKEMFVKLVSSIKKGCFVKASWKSVKVLKGFTIEKVSSGVVRMGIQYSHLKQVKDIETKSLPYGKFEIKDLLIEHNGCYQVRMYPSTCKNHHTSVKYYLNGKSTTKEKLIDMGLLKVEKPTKERLCFNVKLENLLTLG